MTYIRAELRQLVVDRAGGCCEYCRLSQDDGGFAFHFEHIIAENMVEKRVPTTYVLVVHPVTCTRVVTLARLIQ